MLAAFLAQAASPEVVVTAERLHRLRLAASIEGGRASGCTVRVSSGDAVIDRIACRAVDACAADGVVASEPLANCVDARILSYVRGQADVPANDK